jgi:C1q domain
MKAIFIFFIVFVFTNCGITFSQGLSVNATGSIANPSSMLDVSSTTKGVLVPRMTTAQMNAIAAPADGLLIYNTTTTNFWVYHTLTGWQPIVSNPQVGFLGILSANFLLPSSVFTPVTGYNQIYNDGNAFNTSTGQFVAPAAGLYHFDVKIFFTLPAVSGFNYSFRLYVNGSFYPGTVLGDVWDSSIGVGNTIAGSFNLKLNVNDRVDVHLFQSSGSDLTILGFPSSGASTFSGYRVY